MIKILFICHGNICRSPMSEFILKDMVEKRGIKDKFDIASAATSTEEIWNGKGNSIYPPAQAELKKHGIGKTAYTNFSSKRARQVTKQDYNYYDYLLCADSSNIRNTIRITGPDTDNKIKLFWIIQTAKAAVLLTRGIQAISLIHIGMLWKAVKAFLHIWNHSMLYKFIKIIKHITFQQINQKGEVL